MVMHLPLGRGWFYIAPSATLKPGARTPFAGFGEDLVLWRDEAGEAHLMDGFCPHLGASLAHGGMVQGCELVCPFHAWRFDGDGACTGIPFSQAKLEHRGLKSWPVVNRDGELYGWYDADDGLPAFDLQVPDVDRPEDWSVAQTHAWEFPSYWQEVMENTTDLAHFGPVHAVLEHPTMEALEEAGATLRLCAEHVFPTAIGAQPGTIRTRLMGPYLGLVQIRIGNQVEVAMRLRLRPLGARSLRMEAEFRYRICGIEAPESGRNYIKSLIWQVQEDVKIWTHKKYLKHPLLAPGDGPIMQFRRWAEKFTGK